MGNETFKKITNNDIYNRVVALEKKVDKLSVVKWIAGTSLSLSILAISFAARFGGL